MSLACPRCGEAWQGLAPCQGCGYEPEHPGVLGSFRHGARTLARDPLLLVLFALPVLVLVVVQVALNTAGEQGDVREAAVAVTSLVALFLHVWWFLSATGWTVARDQGTGGQASGARILTASALAAVVGLVPWFLLTALIVWSPPGTLGALVQLAVVVLLVTTLWSMGRMTGVPVAAALDPLSTRQALTRGNARARANGGLGFLFLLVAGAGVLFLAVAITGVTQQVALETTGRLLVVSVGLWILEAWVGASMAHGLVADQGPATTFACPRCGQAATARGGRAACACGLEGPYYAG